MLISVLVPLSTKRISFEFLCLTTILSLPALHFSWSFPAPATPEIMGDKLSMILVLLSIWTSILMTLLKPADKFLNLNIILLLWSLASFFLASSFLMFFILFEASLIPTLCLVMGWGYQPERLEASYYFIFYTVMLSIPLLTSLIWLISVSGSKHFFFDDLREVSGILGFFVLSVFMIKLPLFMVHFWLPKAHVEAPVVGSMILAGVLLKTGGYGIVRVFSYMYKTLTSSGYMALSSIGMVYVCFVCLYCTDLKQLIAFSSVSHMNFMIVGLMNNSLVSSSGALFMMVSHGICSSLMFMLADFSYKRSSSRSILVSKGLLMSIPTLALLWSVSVLFNMGVPPSVGSMSELLVVTASAKMLVYKVAFGLYLFLSAFYSVFLYVVVNHGNSMMLGWNLEVKEILASLAHLCPLASLTLITKLMLM